jgi:hypothetical protein
MLQGFDAVRSDLVRALAKSRGWGCTYQNIQYIQNIGFPFLVNFEEQMWV